MKTEQLLKEATARPWSKFPSGLASVVESKKGELEIGDVWCHANAELIVRAVNSFEAMLKLANEITAHLYGKQDIARCRALAEKAIAIAEGKETK